MSASGCLCDFIRMLDDVLMPSPQLCHQRWQTLAVEPGETGEFFIRKAINLAISLDKPDDVTLLQIDTCIRTASMHRQGEVQTCIMVIGEVTRAMSPTRSCRRQHRRLRPQRTSPSA